jgi:hypothetical protein
LLSARRQMTISICRFSSPRAGGRPTAAAKPWLPRHWIVTQRAETARRPVRRSRHRACKGVSGHHPSCFIPTQG